MKLYFSPLACSMATRISLYDAGVEATYVEVNPKTKRTHDGSDFREINPLGLVPVLELDDGAVLSENAAILQYVAERWPESNLAPNDLLGKTRLRQWLCFIGTELHKGLFLPLLPASNAPEGAKEFSLQKAESRLSFLERELTGKEFLLDRFSVADAYLVTVLGWSVVTPIALEKWPALKAYVERLRKRPSVAKALAEEFDLYQKEIRQNAEPAARTA
jgi:glutathione S-transferase